MGENAEQLFRIKDVHLQVRRALLHCYIQDDASTKWGLHVEGAGEGAGRKFRARFGDDDFFRKPPGTVRHWRDLDGTTVNWDRATDPKTLGDMPRLYVGQPGGQEVFKCTTELRHLAGASFRFGCNALCNLYWYPDLTWDLPLAIDVTVTFDGVLAGPPAEHRAYGAKLARVFDPKLFKYVQSSFHAGHRPTMLFRPKG